MSAAWTTITRDGVTRPGARFFPLLVALAAHEFRTRYRSQALGVAWTLLQPVVTMALVAAVLPRVFGGARADVPIFLLIGLVFWSFVSTSSQAAVNALVHRAELVRHTLVPPRAIPLAVLASHVPNLAIEAVAILAFAPFYPTAFRASVALAVVPFVLALAIVLLAGVALVSSALDVLYRDTGYLVTTLLTLGFWVTPVIYPLEAVPERYRAIIAANPLAVMVGALRGAIMEGAVPDAHAWLVMTASAAACFAFGWMLAKRLEGAVLDGV